MTEKILKRRPKMFSASAGISIEPKEAATRKPPISLFSSGGLWVACVSAAFRRPRTLSVTAHPLLCLVGREGGLIWGYCQVPDKPEFRCCWGGRLNNETICIRKHRLVWRELTLSQWTCLEPQAKRA